MNQIIEGDNLTTLDTIPDGYVQFVYLDPPYNTLGKQNKYNDAFQSDEVWLAMMEPRLVKAYSKLLPSGVIAVSIDDSCQAILKVLMDKLFGKKNFVAILIWIKTASQQTTKTFIKKHEYVICYAKDKKQLKMNRKLSPVKDDKRYKFKDEKETFWMVDGKAVFTKPGTEIQNNNYLQKDAEIGSKSTADASGIIGKYDPIKIVNNLFTNENATLRVHMDGNEQAIEIQDNSYCNEALKKNGGRTGNNVEALQIVDNNWMENRATKAADMDGNEQAIEVIDNQHQQSDLTLSATSQTECRIIGKNDPIEIQDNQFFDLTSTLPQSGDFSNRPNLKSPLEISDNNYLQGITKAAARTDHPVDQQQPIQMPPAGTLIYPRTAWRWSKRKIEWAMKNNLVGFKKNKKDEWVAYFKQYKYLTTEKDKQGNYHLVPIIRSQPYDTVLTDIPPDRVLSKLFGTKNTMHYCKPVPLMKRLLEIFTNSNDIVLDIFAGSGTTGQAAYENQRQFILLQTNEANIFDEVLIVRLNATIGPNNYQTTRKPHDPQLLQENHQIAV